MRKANWFVMAAMLLLAVICPAESSAQQVSWTAHLSRRSVSEWNLTLHASIPRGWHMYDLGPYPDGAPIPTSVTLTLPSGASVISGPECSPQPVRRMDSVLGAEVGWWENGADISYVIGSHDDDGNIEVGLEWMICSQSSCMPPDEASLSVSLRDAVMEAGDGAAASIGAAGDSGLWRMILEAVLWGLAALLTPCVFPMVPMTVSFFLGRGRGRRDALLYGASIVLLYTLPIAAVIAVTRLAGGETVTADIFNFLSTHWLPNILFFVIFMLFALSFLGAFEISLPSSLVNSADRRSDGGGVMGVFFMAFTLVLVSFSCTGPIVGTVLIKSVSGEIWAPAVTMLAFSAAFALPFVLLAMFPGMLRAVPKGGAWLQSVRIVIAFIELALGLKFLSVADQTYHWHILDREVYLAIWIAVFSALALYLLGLIRFRGEKPLEHLSPARLLLSLAVMAFVAYLIPGMWGAPLRGLSGYLPPLTTQDFVMHPDRETAALPQESDRKYSDALTLPYSLDGFFDLTEAEEYAAKVGKPLFIDFTGHGCVNCREMEARVWSDPRVLEILRNEYVVVAVYADDRTEAPREDWITLDGGKVLRTMGRINSYMFQKRYGVSSQPCYILQSPEGEILVPSRGYDLDRDAFAEFLRSGLERMSEL